MSARIKTSITASSTITLFCILNHTHLTKTIILKSRQIHGNLNGNKSWPYTLFTAVPLSLSHTHTLCPSIIHATNIVVVHVCSCSNCGFVSEIRSFFARSILCCWCFRVYVVCVCVFFLEFYCFSRTCCHLFFFSLYETHTHTHALFCVYLYVVWMHNISRTVILYCVNMQRMTINNND